MKDLSEGLLDIKIEETSEKVKMNWYGECININPGTSLSTYLDDVAQNFPKEKLLEINFSKLQYMKSSIVPYIVKLLTKLNKEKIKTKILYNTISNWQTATFKALMSVVSIMDYIDIIGIEVKKIT